MTTTNQNLRSGLVAGCSGPRSARTFPLRFVAGVLPLLLAMLVAPAVADDASEVIVINAGRIHTVAGDPLEGGAVIIRDGRIEAVGRDLTIPEGARVFDLRDAVLTPGLIDACCAVDFEIQQEASRRLHGGETKSLWRILSETEEEDPEEPFARKSSAAVDHRLSEIPVQAIDELAPSRSVRQASWAEHASEVTPHRRVLDSVNLFSNDFTRLLKSGVTTVYVSPDSANVIGSRGAILKTGGSVGATCCGAGRCGQGLVGWRPVAPRPVEQPAAVVRPLADVPHAPADDADGCRLGLSQGLL